MAAAQQAQGRVDLCATKPVHARPTTHSIDAKAGRHFMTDELMAVRGGAPPRELPVSFCSWGSFFFFFDFFSSQLSRP